MNQALTNLFTKTINSGIPSKDFESLYNCFKKRGANITKQNLTDIILSVANNTQPTFELQHAPVFVNALQSAGRHLLGPLALGLLSSIGDWGQMKVHAFKPLLDANILNFSHLYTEKVLYSGHFSPEQSSLLEQGGGQQRCRNLFIYRDLRDLVVSSMKYHKYTKQTTPVINMNEKAALMHVISGFGLSNGNIGDLGDQTLTAINRKSHACFSFEEIKNGKSLAVAKIAKVLNIAVNPAICTEIWMKYGDFQSLTGRKQGQEQKGVVLRKGSIGEWTEYFDSEVKDLFKSIAGQQLVALGYEKNLDW